MLDLDTIFDADRVEATLRLRRHSQPSATLHSQRPEAPRQMDVRSQQWAQRASALLATVADAERRVALRDMFEERAAICEHDGGMLREEAERLAFEELRAAADNEAQQSD